MKGDAPDPVHTHFTAYKSSSESHRQGFSTGVAALRCTRLRAIRQRDLSAGGFLCLRDVEDLRQMNDGTRPPRYDRVRALQELAAADPALGRLIEQAGPFTLRLAASQSPFEALLRSIIYQQLHGKAAAAIHAKLLRSFHDAALPPGIGQHPTPQHILDAPNEQLRVAGLSHNKTLALRDLAAKTLDGTIPTLRSIYRMPDAAIIERLTEVRGIGEWTVQMMLMFRLGRPDVLPTSDYGVRKGFALTFAGLQLTDKVTPANLPKPAEMHLRAKLWAPWRSVASWYLWRACDLAAKKQDH